MAASGLGCFRADNFEQIATIPVGKLPHGIWPSGDGTRVYVGLENEDKVAAIDTLKNEVIATSPIGQAPQALVYVPDAVPAVSGAVNSAMTRMMVVPEGLGTNNLQPLGIAGQSAELWLAPPSEKKEAKAPTSVSLSDQGLVQVLEAAVTGLEPGKPYVLALAREPSGTGVLEPLQGFMTNPAGAAIVNIIGPIRQLVRGEDKIPRRYLVILPGPPIPTGPPFKSKGNNESRRVAGQARPPVRAVTRILIASNFALIALGARTDRLLFAGSGQTGIDKQYQRMPCVLSRFSGWILRLADRVFIPGERWPPNPIT